MSKKERKPSTPDTASAGISRRNFLKGAALGAAAVTAVGATGVLANKAISKAAATADAQAAYLKDIAAGDAILRERKYVLMTDAEKRAVVKSFEDNYGKQKA